MKGLIMFLSTYARLFIGFNETFSSQITHYARQTRSKQTAILPITILSSEQVNQSLSHPQNQSLKDFIGTAYADSIRADRMIIKGQESLNEQKIFIEEALENLETKKKFASPATKASIESTKKTLNDQYKLLTNIKNAQEHGYSQLKGLGQEFKDLSTKQDAEWSTYRDSMLKKLENTLETVLETVGLPSLPQGEIDNLLRQDLQDVLDRFEDLGASKDLPQEELSKLLGIKKPDLDTYFKMKAYLAIRSVYPSRENISQHMKKLDHFFNEAKDEGRKILHQHESEIKALDSKVQPIVKVAESNNRTLDQLKFGREQLVMSVASLADLEAIREKTQQRITTVTPERTHFQR